MGAPLPIEYPMRIEEAAKRIHYWHSTCMEIDGIPTSRWEDLTQEERDIQYNRAYLVHGFLCATDMDEQVAIGQLAACILGGQDRFYFPPHCRNDAVEFARSEVRAFLTPIPEWVGKVRGVPVQVSKPISVEDGAKRIHYWSEDYWQKTHRPDINRAWEDCHPSWKDMRRKEAKSLYADFKENGWDLEKTLKFLRADFVEFYGAEQASALSYLWDVEKRNAVAFVTPTTATRLPMYTDNDPLGKVHSFPGKEAHNA